MSSIDSMGITHPDDLQEDLDNMELLNAGKTSGYQIEKRFLKPDGTIVCIYMTVAPVTYINERNPRHLCMIEDITERKRTDERLKGTM